MNFHFLIDRSFILLSITAVLMIGAPKANAEGKVDADESKDVTFTLSMPAKSVPSGDLIVTLTGGGRELLGKAPEAGKTMDLSSAPLAARVGAASSGLSNTIKVPKGVYSVMAFIKTKGHGCAASSTFKPDPSCVPSVGEVACTGQSLDTSNTSQITLSCAPPVK